MTNFADIDWDNDPIHGRQAVADQWAEEIIGFVEDRARSPEDAEILKALILDTINAAFAEYGFEPRPEADASNPFPPGYQALIDKMRKREEQDDDAP